MGKKTKIITITSGKGGVGKTNISLNLSIALTKLGFKVALLDADLALGNADLLIGSKPEYTLEDVIKKDIPIEEVFLKKSSLKNFTLIPAGSGILELTNLKRSEQAKLKREIKKIKDLFDFFLIDTGAGISKEIVNFISLADEVILVLLPEVTSIKDSYSTLKVLKEKNVVKPFDIIVNRAKSKHQVVAVFEKFRETVKKFLQLDITLLGFVPEDMNFQESVNRQIPLINLYPNSSTARVFRHFANVIAFEKGLDGSELDDFFDGIVSVVEEKKGSIDAREEDSVNYKNELNLNHWIATSEQKMSQMIKEINEMMKMIKLLSRRVKIDVIQNSYFNEFQIGEELVFVENNVKFYSAKILGWDFGNYLICETNREIDKLFDTYEYVTARYSFEDKLIEFKTVKVESNDFSNFILIKYPKDYLLMKLRDYKRVPLKIACKVNYKDLKIINGTLYDLSLNGALIGLSYPCDIGDQLVISFVLPNGKEINNLKGVVKNIRDKNRYGVQFLNMSPLMSKRISNFVDTYYKLFIDKTSVGYKEKISGDLSDFSFYDVVQMAVASLKSLVIYIYSEDGEGELYVKNGKVIDAVFGDKIGTDAFYELSTIKEGEFYIEEFYEERDATIEEKVDVLLLNSAYYTDTKKKDEY